VLGEVADEHDRQRHDQQCLTLEQGVDERGDKRGDDDHDHEPGRDQSAGERTALDDRGAPRVARPPGGDRPRDLLLEWLEEAGRGGERENPQHRQRAVALAAEDLPGHGQEQVRSRRRRSARGRSWRSLREQVALAQPLASA
jgi:hypothetical protein